VTVTKKDLTDSPTDNDLNTAFAFQKKTITQLCRSTFKQNSNFAT